MTIQIGDSFIAMPRKAYALGPSIHAPLQAYALETPVPAGLQADGPGNLVQTLPDFKQAFQTERAW
jgi:hypothetical protein